jgi:hypothetical protein
MTRLPILCLDRESLIAEATSAGRCWFVVSAGVLLILLAGFVPGA